MRCLSGIKSIRLIRLFVRVLVLKEVLGSVTTSARKLSAKEAFLNGSFSACKGLRWLNPVETVRAHVFATKTLNTFGVKNMVRYATELEIPSFAVYSLSERVCIFYLMTYAHLSKREDLLLPRKLTSEAFQASVRRVLVAMEKGCPSGLTRWHIHGNFTMPWSAVQTLFSRWIPAVLAAGDDRPPPDPNFLLHTTDYVRSILL